MAAARPSLSLSYLDEFLPDISPTTRADLAAAMDAHDAECRLQGCGGCGGCLTVAAALQAAAVQTAAPRPEGG